MGATEVQYLRGPSGERARGRSVLELEDMLSPGKDKGPRQGAGHPHKDESQDTTVTPRTASASALSGPPALEALRIASASQGRPQRRASGAGVSDGQRFPSWHRGKSLPASAASPATETLRLYQVMSDMTREV